MNRGDQNLEVSELLASWGYESLVTRFQENEVDIDSMKVLSHEDVAALVPKVGPRAKFLSKLKEWQLAFKKTDNNFAIEEGPGCLPHFLFTPQPGASRDNLEANEQLEFRDIPNTNDLHLFPVDASSVTDKPQQHQNVSQANSINQIELECFIEDWAVGKCKRHIPNTVNRYIDEDPVNSAGIREAFDSESKQTFNDKHRLQLSRLIVTKELKNDVDTKIRPERFEALAAEIKEIFPGEDPHVYYIPRCIINNKDVAPKGKLYNQYTNLVKKLRNHGLRGKNLHEPEENELCGGDCDGENVANDLEWLSIRVEPWTSVLEKWKTTADYRLASLKKSASQNTRKRKKPGELPAEKIGDYLEKYRALRQPNGYELLELDFLHLYPHCELNLQNRWKKFAEKVQQLSSPNAVSPADLSPVTVLHNFAKLFDPITLVARTGKFKSRPTKAEIAEGLLLHVKVIDDLQPAIGRMRAKAEQLKATLQPLAAVVGPHPQDIVESYVIIDNIIYKADNPLRAIDICFKSFHALHAEYAMQSKRPWLVLQQIIYDIKTPWDAQIPSVIQMCKKLVLA